MGRAKTKKTKTRTPVPEHLHTLAQIGRILHVPESLLRTWIRLKLIRPTLRQRGVEYFDFREMTRAKRVREILAQPIDPEALAMAVRSVRSWLGDEDDVLARIEVVNDALRVRTDDGSLVDPSSQLALGLDAPAATTPDPKASMFTGEEWFERALAFEEEGDLDKAVSCYEEALDVGDGPSAEAAFNLGNVLYALDRPDEALARYADAIELDTEYIEAWNNLASVQADLGHWQDAVESGKHALRLAPGYPDTHYNLAQAYHALGDLTQARHHARVYVSYDPESEWARMLRQKLDLG